MLNLLIEYAQTHGMTIEPGFKPKTVRWAIVCNADGQFLNIQELGNPDDRSNRGRGFPVCPDLSLPEMKAGGSGCRHFLVDNVEVVAMVGKDGDLSGDEKIKAKHKYFISLLRQAAGPIGELAGIATLLDSSERLATIQRSFSEQRFKSTDYVTFAVLGRDPMFLVEDVAWHDWWRGFRRSLGVAKAAKKEKPAKLKGDKETAENRGVVSMRCLGSGAMVRPAPTHPKIEGLSDVGGLSMGDSLASFKQESFGSYFLGQAENAAVSEVMAAAYRGGLNSLIARHSRRLTGTKVVHWFSGRDEVPDDLNPFNWLIECDDTSSSELDAHSKAGKLLDAIRTGRREDLMNYRFYCLTVSGASGRVMVREWFEGRFEKLVQSIDNWFGDLSIARRDGSGLAPPPKFLAVLGGLVRDLSDIPSPEEANLWRVAVRGEPIPRWAMAQALARVKVDMVQDSVFNHARFGILKAYHIRKGDREMQPYLNEEHPHPAYHCGRLLAVYAALQRAALGDVGAGVIQRYYAAASATPALILGRLSRGSQFHLNKLSDRHANWYQQRVASIWACLKDSVPKVLTLEEQTLFALGYYQQMARPSKDENQTENNESKGAQA